MEDKKNHSTDLLLIIASVILLFLDTYINAFQLMDSMGFTSTYSNKFILSLLDSGIIKDKGYTLKTVILGLLILTALANRPKRKVDVNKKRLFATGIFGLLLFYLSNILGYYNIPYIITTISGYFMLIYFSVTIQKFVSARYLKDRFDTESREFEQNELLVENEYSVNIPYQYRYKKRIRTGWINIINPFRGTLISGVPGTGKTFATLEEAIRQFAKKGFAMCVYDYKYPDLTQATYSYVTEYFDNYDVEPSFHVLNLDDPKKSHRCNPLQPDLLTDFSDAMESANSIMLGLNKTWIKKQGDFFVESPINMVSCGIWMLKIVHESLGEQYCTFPHLIELISLDYDSMFGCLTAMDDTSISNIMSPFLAAWESKTMEQLEGQIASVRLGLSRITNKGVYWATTGSDFSLDINNPQEPKILCLANNPERQSIYGVVLSLYASRMIRLINKKGKRKTGLFFDELPTIYLGVNTLDNLIATGRSNLIAVFMGIQDVSQMIRDYGKDVADAIINIVGNIITGMIGDKAAESFSKKIGKIKVGRTSVNISRNDTSVNMSEVMEPIAPVEVLSKLGQGELAGIISDNFNESVDIEKKAFIGKVVIDMKYKKLIHKHKLPDMTEFPEGMDIDELLEQNMINIRKSVRTLSDILNFRIPYNMTEDKELVKTHIEKFIQIARNRKKSKIIRITSQENFSLLIEELTEDYISEASAIKQALSEQLGGSEPDEKQKRKFCDHLMNTIRIKITEKVDNLAGQEVIEF